MRNLLSYVVVVTVPSQSRAIRKMKRKMQTTWQTKNWRTVCSAAKNAILESAAWLHSCDAWEALLLLQLSLVFCRKAVSSAPNSAKDPVYAQQWQGNDVALPLQGVCKFECDWAHCDACQSCCSCLCVRQMLLA
eukprot:2410255-Amphidinium_carterae.1